MRLLRLGAARVSLAMTLLDALAIGMVSLIVLLMVQQSTGRFDGRIGRWRVDADERGSASASRAG